MKLQLTIDHGKDHEILAYLERVAHAVDVIEIGYPVVVTYGLTLVREIRKRHADVPLCVDAKVFHGGTGVTARCFEAGADIVTVLCGAPNPVISQMVRKAQGYGGQIMCDMAGARIMGQRVAEVDELGVDYVMVPTGFRPEYNYDLEAHRRPFLSFLSNVRPLDLAGAAKRNVRHARLALSTGINEQNIRQVVSLGPELVLVGRAILDADDPVAAAQHLKRMMPYEG